MKIEKAKIRLERLKIDLQSFIKDGFYGYKAKNSEVIFFWNEYNFIRLELIKYDNEHFEDLRSMELPTPDIAQNYSSHEIGTEIYYPSHFEPLLSEVNVAIEFIKLLDSNSFTDKSLSSISINAKEGASVNVIVGNNNSSVINNNKIEEIYKNLKDLGIENSQINELDNIISKSKTDKGESTNLGNKIFKWFGQISQKLIEKGLTDNLPKILEKVSDLSEFV
ncbi:MAG: hypothetical protein ACEQSR_06870 [Candidatus Methylacidiphilales bacterium]